MRTSFAAFLLVILVGSAPAGEVKLTAGPTATKAGEKVTIAFTVSAPTDVEVAVLGADGKVVRHLAAGVLGAKNPPPEPLKPGLAQSLEWDGKGDWNLPVGPGPFKVRVRAGMGVRFERTIGATSPYNFNEMFCRGLATDPSNGDLYFCAQWGSSSELVFVRVYDRAGKYLREIMPFPAGLDAESLKAFGTVPVPGAAEPVPANHLGYWPSFHPFVNSDAGFKLIGLQTGGKPNAAFLDERFRALSRIRCADGGAPEGAPVSEPLWDAGAKFPAEWDEVGPAMGAFSPDGKAVYLAGYCSRAVEQGKKVNAVWPEGRIWKMELGKGKARPFADIALPEGWPARNQPHAGPRNGFQALHGLAVNKDGQVFVCDAAGGKVWVFGPDGKALGSTSVPDAYMAAVDGKTGALYVLTNKSVGYMQWDKSLVKLSGWGPDGKVADTLKLAVNGIRSPYLAGDFGGDAPVLWVSGSPRTNSLLRIEDRGGKLAVAEDLAERDKGSSGFASRMDVDPEADLVYLNNSIANVLRYSGLTGEYAGERDKDGRPKPLVASEFCIRRDGMLYLSGADGGYSGNWVRLNRDLTPAPLADKPKGFGARYGKMAPFATYGNQGSCVTPDGRVYYNSMFSFRINCVFELNPDGSAGRGPRLQEVFAEEAAKKEDNSIKWFGSHGLKGALVGPIQDMSGGLEVDQKGCLYVGLGLQVQGAEAPPEFATFPFMGTVVKFGPDGGAMLPDPEKVKPGTKYECYKNPSLSMPVKVGPGLYAKTRDYWAPGFGSEKRYLEGALKAYPLLSNFSMYCSCKTPRFDVDDYGRLYIPNALGASVRVLDNEGNEIMKFGSYGNHDDGVRAEAAAAKAAGEGAASSQPKPAIPIAYPMAAKASFKHIYVADEANRRAVRVDPTWKAEAVCEVK